MNWLVTALVTPILNWAGGIVASGLSSVYRFWSEYQKAKERYDESNKQGDLVDSIAEQIKKLQSEGKPVPPELERRLIDESSKIRIGAPFNN